MSQTYLITGCNRGIGLEFVRYLSKDPSNTIVATVRDATKVVGDLKTLVDSNSNIKIVTLELGSEESVNALSAQVEKVAPEGIDVLISNAGLGNSFETLLNAPWSAYDEHFRVNATGPLKMVQALKEHMMKKQTRKIFFSATLMASLQNYMPIVSTVYSISKCAMNLGVKSTAVELQGDGFTVVAIEPGVCDTDIFNIGFNISKDHFPPGMADFVLSMKKPASAAVEGLVENIINKATPKDNGKILSWNGDELAF